MVTQMLPKHELYQKGEGFSLLFSHITLTIDTAKSLASTQKLENIIWCYSVSCLSLCIDQLNYVVIDVRDALVVSST